MILEPARASTGGSAPAVLASNGGPTFTTGPAPGTAFPLLQTTLVDDGDSLGPDNALNAAGGTASLQSGNLVINMNGFDGDPGLPEYSNLDWTLVGYWSTGGVWDYAEDQVRHRAVFVAGYETPASAMPASGTATYTGRAQGWVYIPTAQASGMLLCNCEETAVTGNAAFTANFGTRNLTGSLTDMRAPHPWYEGETEPWNDVAFTATIAGNGFSGATRVTSSPGQVWALGEDATGTIEGKFFGPSAQEAGAVWTLFDGTNAVIGTLSGRKP